MPGVMRISERASLALHAAAFLASRGNRRTRVGEMSRGISCSEAHLSKVLQALGRAGLLEGTRGPAGGYRLARDPERITLLQVTEAVEGPLDLRGCLMGTPICAGKRCLLGDHVDVFNRRLRDYLAGAAVADFAHLFAGKTKGKGPRPGRTGKGRS